MCSAVFQFFPANSLLFLCDLQGFRKYSANNSQVGGLRTVPAPTTLHLHASTAQQQPQIKPIFPVTADLPPWSLFLHFMTPPPYFPWVQSLKSHFDLFHFLRSLFWVIYQFANHLLLSLSLNYVLIWIQLPATFTYLYCKYSSVSSCADLVLPRLMAF